MVLGGRVLRVLAVSENARASASSAPTDSLMWNWVALDSAAISIFSPLLAPEQITATRWTTDSLLTNGFGSGTSPMPSTPYQV